MFGEGTYLSGELAVSMTYSPTGLTWDCSELGNKLGCVAVCEMIDDSSVKCQEKTGLLLLQCAHTPSLQTHYVSVVLIPL